MLTESIASLQDELNLQKDDEVVQIPILCTEPSKLQVEEQKKSRYMYI